MVVLILSFTYQLLYSTKARAGGILNLDKNRSAEGMNRMNVKVAFGHDCINYFYQTPISIILSKRTICAKGNDNNNVLCRRSRFTSLSILVLLPQSTHNVQIQTYSSVSSSTSIYISRESISNPPPLPVDGNPDHRKFICSVADAHLYT